MILITGASGRSSALIIQEFIRQKTKIRALVRDLSTASEFAVNPYVDIMQGNIGEPKTLQPALDSVETALLISSPRGAMVQDQCSFIDTAKSMGTKRVVKCSGKETGLNFISNNFSGTRDHESIERYLEASGLAWTHLRPSQFMQVYLDELPSIKANQKLIRPMGDARVTPIDIRDVAKVAYRVLTERGHEGVGYDLTGPEALSMSDIADILSKVLGREIPYYNVSPAEYSAAMKAEGAPPPVIDILSEIYSERKKSRYSRVNLEAYKKFGLSPTSFEAFAHEHAAKWSL